MGKPTPLKKIFPKSGGLTGVQPPPPSNIQGGFETPPPPCLAPLLLNCINRLRTNLVHRNYICMINDDNWQQNKFLQCNFDISNERLTPLQPFNAFYV